MKITVNGEPREVPDGLTVSGLLALVGVKDERVAVEVNVDVVRREARADRILVEGDQVEIVSFVGGGN